MLNGSNIWGIIFSRCNIIPIWHLGQSCWATTTTTAPSAPSSLFQSFLQSYNYFNLHLTSNSVTRLSGWNIWKCRVEAGCLLQLAIHFQFPYSFYFLGSSVDDILVPVTSILPVTTAPCLLEDCKHRASSSYLPCVLICHRRLSRIQVYYSLWKVSGLYVSMHPLSCTRKPRWKQLRHALLSWEFQVVVYSLRWPWVFVHTESSLILHHIRLLKRLLFHVPQICIVERGAFNCKLDKTVVTNTQISYNGWRRLRYRHLRW
jgi:hypothetical protein